MIESVVLLQRSDFWAEPLPTWVYQLFAAVQAALTFHACGSKYLTHRFTCQAFDKWAPKSSRAWRLGQGAGPRSPPGGWLSYILWFAFSTDMFSKTYWAQWRANLILVQLKYQQQLLLTPWELTYRTYIIKGLKCALQGRRPWRYHFFKSLSTGLVSKVVSASFTFKSSWSTSPFMPDRSNVWNVWIHSNHITSLGAKNIKVFTLELIWLWVSAEQSSAEQTSADEDFVNSLNARISQMGSVRDSMQEDEEPSPLASFEGATDDELARRFNSRLEEVSSSAPDDSVPLTGSIFSFSCHTQNCVIRQSSCTLQMCIWNDHATDIPDLVWLNLNCIDGIYYKATNYFIITIWIHE